MPNLPPFNRPSLLYSQESKAGEKLLSDFSKAALSAADKAADTYVTAVGVGFEAAGQVVGQVAQYESVLQWHKTPALDG